MNSNCNVPHNTDVTMQLTTPNTVPMNTQAKEVVSSIKKTTQFTTDSPIVGYKPDEEKVGDQLRFELIRTDSPDKISADKSSEKENKN